MVLDEVTSNSKEKAVTSLPISFSSVRETSEGARCSERGEEKKRWTRRRMRRRRSVKGARASLITASRVGHAGAIK